MEQTAFDNEPLPAIYEHCERIYYNMAELAQPDPDNFDLPVYEGFLTRLFADSNLSVPYYSHVMRLLTAMDCTRQLRRGGGNAPSRWALIQAPTPELFNLVRDQADALTNPRSRSAQQRQWAKDLNERLGVLEEKVEDMLGRMSDA